MSVFDKYKYLYNKPVTSKEGDKTWDNTYEYRFICNNCNHSNSTRVTKGIKASRINIVCINCKCKQ